MLVAGFQVAKGRSTGSKSEATIAFTTAALENGLASRHELLGSEWLAKWQRSQARIPTWVLPEGEVAFADAVLGHPQFAQ